MPSVNPADSVDSASYEHDLLDFKERIKQCLAAQEWEQLPTILSSRQAYLEQIFTQPIPDNLRDSVKQLMQSLLSDDAAFLAQVQEHQSALMKQQLSFDRGFRATQAYKNS